eukprot:5068902-Prymnesium_polylepis.1
MGHRAFLRACLDHSAHAIKLRGDQHLCSFMHNASWTSSIYWDSTPCFRISTRSQPTDSHTPSAPVQRHHTPQAERSLCIHLAKLPETVLMLPCKQSNRWCEATPVAIEVRKRRALRGIRGRADMRF